MYLSFQETYIYSSTTNTVLGGKAIHKILSLLTQLILP